MGPAGNLSKVFGTRKGVKYVWMMNFRFSYFFFPFPGLLVLMAVPLATVFAPEHATAEAITVNTTRVEFNPEDPGKRSLGSLRYRGGLHLRSSAPGFGGLSALGVSSDGRRLIALSDRGRRFSARLVYDENGDLAGLRQTELDSLAGLDGLPLSSKADGDAESMSPGVEGEIIVAFERRHRLWRYLPGVTVPVPLPGPVELPALPYNNGIEALTLLADGSLLALSEGQRGRGNSVGWISDANGWSVLTYVTDDRYRVTGAATLPGGDVIVLERFFTPRGYNNTRLKRIAQNTIKAGARLSGKILAEIRPPYSVDNFEGIDARRGKNGEVFVYLVSDDNFNPDQRTLLMMFELTE